MNENEVRRPLPNQKIFAVGDIHGSFQKLTTLLGRLPINPDTDFLIFLGDYLDRGKESQQVVRMLLDVETRVRNAVFLLGNHEYSLLQYANTGNPDHLRLLRALGIEETLESYGDSPVHSMRDLSFLPEEHRDFLTHLRPYFRLGEYLFIHAGVIPGEDVDQSPLDKLLTVRHAFLNSPGPPNTIVIFGHTPFETPFVTFDKIGIDTGAVYGNLLTAVELPRLRFFHA